MCITAFLMQQKLHRQFLMAYWFQFIAVFLYLNTFHTLLSNLMHGRGYGSAVALAFLDCLSEAHTRFNFQVLYYCLMKNHLLAKILGGAAEPGR